MKKGDDAKSTKDVKEGDGFILSYSNHSYENYTFQILLGMAMVYLEMERIYLLPLRKFILQTENDYTMALYEIF